MTSRFHPIDDLSSGGPEATTGTCWQMLSDAVMGGVSTGRMSCGSVARRPAIRMQGDVSLANNGGFIQIALDLAPDGGSFDASRYAGVELDVLGNAEEYGLHLRTTELPRPWQSYRMTFIAGPRWQQIRLPFSGFVPHRTDMPLNLHLLRRIGIVAIGRAFSADVAVGRIGFYLPD